MDKFRYIPKEAFGDKTLVRIRDIGSVVENYRLFKQKADLTGSICAVVLKAEVHGLQMKDVAPALYGEGVRHYFVEEICEGIKLRKILPQEDAEIFAMAGLLQDEESYFIEYKVTPCITCLEQLKRWNDYCSFFGKGSAVIHLDTHMNRLGLLDEDVKYLGKNFDQMTGNLDVLFYMSHFFDIKGTDHTNCSMQNDVLKGYLEQLPDYPVTFACTDSVILLENEIFNYDMIRPGIGLVGGAPNQFSPISKEARHTFELYAKISQIKTVKKGEKIGYGGAYTLRRDTKLALAHIGYKDGYLRVLSETDQFPKGVFMQLEQYQVPIIGKISLGMTMLDVTDVPMEVLEHVHYVEVVGPHVDIKFLADQVGCYEILAALGRENPKISDYTLDEFNEQFLLSTK